MNPTHTNYYRHRTRKYLVRVYPEQLSGRCAHRALRYTKHGRAYFVTLTCEQIEDEFERVKAVSVPESMRP